MIRSITRVEHTDHPACGAQRIPPHSPACTLPAGHTGWHLATDETGNETLAYWPASDK